MIMSPQSLEVPKIKIKIRKKKLFLFLKLQVTEESNVYHLKKVSFSSGGRAQALWVMLLICVYVHVL
jgi:hypothetical protein